MKRFFAVSFFLAIILIAFGRTYTQFSHYSIKEGLSEINVQCMLQDKKGQMWFGTFDGLNKFNGYTFKTYKTNPGQLSGLENYRITRIKEDQNGYLWIQTYDDHIFQFDTQTETFLQVPQCNKEFADYKVKFKNFYTLKDGSIWLTGDEDGCLRITYDENNNLSIVHLGKNNDQLTSNKVNSVYLDSKKNTWILTSNGVNLLKAKSNKPIKLFQEKENSGFLSIIESGNYVWLGGEHGKLRYYDLRKESFEGITIPCPSDIIAIKKTSKEKLFILTNHNGFYIYNTVNQQLTAFNKSTGSGIIDDNFYSCNVDKKNNIWIESKNPSVVYFQTESRKIFNFDVKPIRTSLFAPNPNFIFKEDIFGNIWIQPRLGSFCKYNPITNKLEMFYNDPDMPDQKFSSQMHSAYSDRQGNLWICPYSHGIEKIVFSESPFHFIKPTLSEIGSAGNEIRVIYQDRNNRIWTGAKNGIITIYDEKLNKIGILGIDGRINGSIPLKASIYSVAGDKKGNIWLGSKGDGLFRLSEINDGSSMKYKISHYVNNVDDIYSLSSNNVYSIFEDHLNRIWVATYGGGINLLENQNDEIRFINSKNKLKNYPIDQGFRSRFITEDKKGIIMVGTTGGLIVFRADAKKPEDISFHNYTHTPGDKETLSGNDVYSILPSSNGKLYLAIFGGGINILNNGVEFNKKPAFKSIEVENGLPSNIIFTLKEDKKGDIWFTTQTEICRFNPNNQQFDTYSPLNENPYVFVEAAVCVTRSGEFAYGTSEGLVSFNPQKAIKSNFVPRIVLSNFQLFNKNVEVGVMGSPLQKVIDETKELVLTHEQNIFSISFAALDYTNPQNIQYAYKLDGLETDWNYVHDQRIATYTNLPKGKYIFRVKSTNADGVWVENERSMVIVKEPSFWESVWGFLFYILIFLGLAALAMYILYTFFRLRTDVEVEHRMTNMKLRFFTDISHELRTPLTLIASPVENILRTETLSEPAREQLTVVQRNTERMLRLINQILDFRKIQNKKMKLLVELIQPGSFMKEISANFSKMSEERKIDFKIIDLSNYATIWADKDKFEKIFFNLLSNAFKFTQPGNSIEVIISDNQDTISVAVKDRGMGMNKDRVKLLFNRFESMTGANVSFQQGTGIGLSLTKELVELHHAKIDVESEPGKGSSFKVTFLKGHDHFLGDDEAVTFENSGSDIVESEATEPENLNYQEQINDSEKQSILIVEDNTELRAFLRTVLIRKYEILEAENGLQALEIARREIPDIIITDVMMPEMNGMELAKTVKEDIKISHIPIVLLTAKTDMENKLEALQYGVDDYITKPFSSAYLEARIENLLKLRKQLQELYRSSLTSGVISPSKPNVVSQDDIFIQRIMTYIENNIENSEITIDEIANHVAFGRSTFFKKLKSLTGLSPIEFLRDMRIQRAAQLIETGEYNFSEITYMVGISDPRYFSRVFKQKFGISPREYKDRCQENENKSKSE